MSLVSFREPIDKIVFMFVHSSLYISGYTRIKNAIVFVRENIGIVGHRTYGLSFTMVDSSLHSE